MISKIFIYYKDRCLICDYYDVPFDSCNIKQTDDALSDTRYFEINK